MFDGTDIPILSILRGIQKEDIKPLVEIFIKTGIRYTEITMNTLEAPELIKAMKKEAGSELIVGAGTVLSVNDLNKAIDSGASFIVCPSVIDDVIDRCCDKDIPIFPGALTPTEVHRAWDLGATMVKIFPASVFGPPYIKALKAPFDGVKIMAVGGVNEESIVPFFKNGADAIAVGGSIFKRKWMDEGRFSIIEEKLLSLIRLYKQEYEI